MVNLYITPFEYKRAPTGQETASLIGNLGRLSTTLTAGQTTMSVVPNLAVTLSQYDLVTIFDGANSEVVTVGAAGASGGTSSVPISAAQFTHAAGTVYCSDGTLGSLSEAITIASGMVEDICFQSLMQANYTDTLNLRTMNAAITNEGIISIQPRHFPVTAVSAITLETSVNSIFTIDVTQAIIETRQRLVNVPVVSQVINGQPTTMSLRPPLNQSASGFANITYTAGFTYANLPWTVKQACILLTSLSLSDRVNPTGAAQYQSGKVNTQVYLRGDTSAESSLFKRAEGLLELYKREQ